MKEHEELLTKCSQDFQSQQQLLEQKMKLESTIFQTWKLITFLDTIEEQKNQLHHLEDKLSSSLERSKDIELQLTKKMGETTIF